MATNYPNRNHPQCYVTYNIFGNIQGTEVSKAGTWFWISKEDRLITVQWYAIFSYSRYYDEVIEEVIWKFFSWRLHFLLCFFVIQWFKGNVSTLNFWLLYKRIIPVVFLLAVLVFERYLRDWVALYSLPTMPFSVCKIISIWSLFVLVLSISQKGKILLLWKNISCDEFKFLPKLKRLFISDKMMRMRVML